MDNLAELRTVAGLLVKCQQKIEDLETYTESQRMLPANARYVLIPLFSSLTGYTPKAIRRKIEDGVWVEGGQFRRAPDGHILMDLQGYYEWVEKRKR